MIPPKKTGEYRISDITVIDVENGIAIPGQTVKIFGDKIASIGLPGGPDVPERTQNIDGHGLYLMPGLVDAHVHFLEAPVFGRLMIANGVTLVREMGLPNELIFPMRDALNRGEMLGPEMRAAGAILDGDPPLIPLISKGVKTPEEGRTAVHEQIDAGADLIKVYTRLERDVFLAIVEEAHQCGRKAIGHVPETVYIEEAAAAGLDSSEHFFGFEKAIASLIGDTVKLKFIGMGSDAWYLERLDEVEPDKLEAFFQRIKNSGLTVCPTVITFRVGTQISHFKAGNFPRQEYLSPMVMGVWNSMWGAQEDIPDYVWKNWARMVRGLNEAGVPLMVGTDLMLPGVFPGYAVHEEMAIWQEAGIPPADVLRGATLTPAKFLGLEERLGSVSEGKTASLVLVRGNPLEDIRNAEQIEGVFLRGKYFNRAELAGLLEEAKVLANPPESAQ